MLFHCHSQRFIYDCDRSYLRRRGHVFNKRNQTQYNGISRRVCYEIDEMCEIVRFLRKSDCAYPAAAVMLTTPRYKWKSIHRENPP